MEKQTGFKNEADFDKWVGEVETRLFQKEKFEAIGKGDDYVFQALAFTGDASGKLSLATTILSDLDKIPKELKEELKSIQTQLHDFKEKLRNI
jgi:cob(I)alamin adenosyltransferase